MEYGTHRQDRRHKLSPPSPCRQENHNGPFHSTLLCLCSFICETETGTVNTQDKAGGRLCAYNSYSYTELFTQWLSPR